MIERRIKAAKFPATKSLDSFDFTAIPSLNKALTWSWRAASSSTAGENVIALGPSGTGEVILYRERKGIP
jgi:DNA replication protein DnaC